MNKWYTDIGIVLMVEKMANCKIFIPFEGRKYRLKEILKLKDSFNKSLTIKTSKIK